MLHELEIKLLEAVRTSPIHIDVIKASLVSFMFRNIPYFIPQISKIIKSYEHHPNML